MKWKLFSTSIFILICSMTVFSQVDYTKPEFVAQRFLDLCVEGERLVAAEKYATSESMIQIEVLIRQMVMNDKPLKDEHCKYFVEGCNVDSTHHTANCIFRKVCENGKGNSKGNLVLKLTDEKWLVEYIYKRDKYL